MADLGSTNIYGDLDVKNNNIRQVGKINDVTGVEISYLEGLTSKVQTQLNGKASNTISITAGNGLSGGGTLADTRTVTLGTPSTITNSTTNSVTSTSHTHALTLTKADITALGIPGADTNTTYTAGAGLTLMGTVFTPTFGNTLGTVVQGNDSRLSDARTPLTHNHPKSEITGLPTKLSEFSKDINFDERYYTETETNTLLGGKVDNSRVLTDVPINAVFTDTRYTAGANISIDGTNKISATNTTYSNATQSVSGLMSATDKTRVDNLGTAANKNVGISAGNVPELDSSGKLNTSTLPALAITETYPVSSQAAMLALTAETGDIAIRTDLSKSFILRQSPATTLSNWSELLTPTQAVQSVNGKTGAVTLTSVDVGAAATSHSHGNITVDGKIGSTANLPILTGVNGVLETKAAGTTAQYLRGDGSWAVPTYPTSLPANGGAADSAKHLLGDDTRSANLPPSAYMSGGARWAGRAGWQTEFKTRTAIDSPPLSGTYVYLQTHTPWNDPSGGYPIQVVYGNGFPAWRVGTSTTTWSAWQALNEGGNSATTNGFTLGMNVPAGSKLTDTVYSVFSTAADGLVPKSMSSNTTDYLRRDGTWAAPPNTNTTYSAGNGIGLSGTTFSVAGGYGLIQESSGLKLGDPTTVTNTTTNSVTSTGHTHALTLTKADITGLGIPAQDTTYSEITEAEIDAGTSSTLRVVTGRRIKYILDKVTTMISALTKSDIELSNVENKSSATIRSEITSSNVTTALGYTPANTTNEHTHSNKAVIDKFSESGGAPLYDGQPLGGGNTNIVTVKNTVTLASDSNTVSIGIAEFDSNRDTLLVYKNSVFADDYFVAGDGLSIQKNTGTWDSGTVFNFVAFQLAEVAEDTGLLQGVFTVKRQEFTATEGQAVFTISNGSYVPNANRLSVYIWGSKQYNNAFIETTPTSFTMSAGLSAGDKVIAEWIEAVNISGLYEGHASTHAVGGGDTITPDMIGADMTIISTIKPTNGATMWYQEVV